MAELKASAYAAVATLTCGLLSAFSTSTAGAGVGEPTRTPAASAKSEVKYSAQIRLSAASPAATSDGVMPRYSETAT